MIIGAAKVNAPLTCEPYFACKMKGGPRCGHGRMTADSSATRLEGLIDLDRKGVDIRPTLLRVLTDQYMQSVKHTKEEERQYVELALRLICETDVLTRAAVAARLAPHATAPRQILLMLARDELPVAEPILKQSPCLTPADCAAIVRDRGQAYADIIAQRGRQPREEAALPSRATEGRVAAQAIAHVEAQELAELFYAAGSAERRLILVNLDYATSVPPSPPAPIQRADIWRLESAALQHNTQAAVRELEAALGISNRHARRMVEDELGEPIVVAAKAMNLPADVLQRIILFMNPHVGQSVDRVYELASLYSEISVAAACRLIAIIREADPAPAKPRHDPLTWHSAAESTRRALSEISRPASPRRDALDLERPTGTYRR
jgi:hypothetical protein